MKHRESLFDAVSNELTTLSLALTKELEKRESTDLFFRNQCKSLTCKSLR